MKKLYTNRIVSVEQFTDEFTPEGVMIADKVFIENVLIPSIQKEIQGSTVYLFKLPKPDAADKQVAKGFNVPFPFQWIKKGDYVLTYSSGYTKAETQESFERDYKEIEVK